jgi:hypothetical protein
MSCVAVPPQNEDLNTEKKLAKLEWFIDVCFNLISSLITYSRPSVLRALTLKDGVAKPASTLELKIQKA